MKNLNKFIDLLSFDDEEEPEKKVEVMEKRKMIPMSEPESNLHLIGEKKFLRYEDGEVLHVNEYIKTLNFIEKVKLLFGKDTETETEEITEEAPSKSVKKSIYTILFGICLMLSVLYLAFTGVQSLLGLNGGTSNPNTYINQPSEIGSGTETQAEYFQENEWSNISDTVTSEIALYNREETRKIEDYLDMRANRGSTLTAIKMQRTKKENTYFYLAQNRDYFKNNLADYEKLEKQIVASLSFSEQALYAFTQNNTAPLLRSLLAKN